MTTVQSIRDGIGSKINIARALATSLSLDDCHDSETLTETETVTLTQ